MRASLIPLALVALAVAPFFACKSEPAPAAKSSPSDGDSGPGASSSGSGKNEAGLPVSANVTLSRQTVQFKGQTRSYILAKPNDYDANKKYPLVYNFHGNPSNAQVEADSLPFDSVSKKEAVIVYPDALTGDWDFAPLATNVDMEWIKGLADEVATKASIDKTKVWAFGYSGGAYFISQMACRVPGAFRALAILSGGAPEPESESAPTFENGCAKCGEGAAVPTLVMHGMNDMSEVPFAGGEFAATCWATTNGCNDMQTDLTAPCKKREGCAAGKPVTWCPVPNQDHGPWNKALQTSWDFFKALP